MSRCETKKFSLGRIVATPGAIHAILEAGQSADESRNGTSRRHRRAWAVVNFARTGARTQKTQ